MSTEHGRQVLTVVQTTVASFPLLPGRRDPWVQSHQMVIDRVLFLRFRSLHSDKAISKIIIPSQL